jgi:hypothetical protein
LLGGRQPLLLRAGLADRLLETGSSLFGLTGLGQSFSEAEMQLGIFGVAADGLAQVGDSFLPLAEPL